MTSDRYKETLEFYKGLDEKYARFRENVAPKEIYEFIKLLPKKGKILDAGCCGGRDSKIFSQKGLRVVGIDATESFLRVARKKVPKAKFIKMNLLKLKFPKDCFDAIWAHAVLLHIKRKDIPKVLKDFYRILKPGGVLHITVKKGKGTTFKKEKFAADKRRIFVYFTKKEMERFVKEAGFKIIISRFFPDSFGRKDIKWIRIWVKK